MIDLAESGMTCRTRGERARAGSDDLLAAWALVQELCQTVQAMAEVMERTPEAQEVGFWQWELLREARDVRRRAEDWLDEPGGGQGDGD